MGYIIHCAIIMWKVFVVVVVVVVVVVYGVGKGEASEPGMWKIQQFK